ncbi:paraflagellar rod protein, putative [Trypanosoma cruzi marinkellei]|uniref:Paraflagellar rod protein, putative n=1 Tax=Trypanosoma cruzi marinkellei TaxID=85056 RepID=K2MUV6_TRYCR|nr:paraflagellar rod protein, putative [Trypanosoma cruzi marinkellei]
MAAQKWFFQREAVLDTCTVPTGTTTSVEGRRRMARDSATQILSLLEELQATIGPSANGAAAAISILPMTKAAGGMNNNNNNNHHHHHAGREMDGLWMSALVEGSGSLFRSECGLEVEAREMRLPDGHTMTTAAAAAATVTTSSSSSSPTKKITTTQTTTSTTPMSLNPPSAEAVTRRLQPLQRILASIQDMRHLTPYGKLISSAGKGDKSAESISMLIKGLHDAVEESLRTIEHGYATCACSVDDISAWAEWSQPLLRLLGETLRRVTLEHVMEESQERLRRATFDVKEKQREQEDAVTDGDMVRSENLYFEKTALLEGMRPLYDQLEHVIETYKKDAAEEPTRKLRALANELVPRLVSPRIAKEQNLKKRCTADIERLACKREELRSVRSTQRANFSVQMNEWEKLFDLNRQQQEACLRAIEELEQRLRHLAEERTFLVEDRLEKISEERQREEDATVFMLFAERQEEALRTTLQHVEQSLHCAQNISDAVQSGYKHLNQHLQNVVLQTAETQLLNVRKERLEHFRSLYLTLGELQFKKERHMEELDKRIEYYHVQQELAMETFNPKAKEFSKAKKDLLEVKETMEQQLQLIATKAAQQLEDFKPTEKLLLASGVQFRHPAEELLEMNAMRTQKLLEYHSLMSTMRKDDDENKEDADRNTFQPHLRRGEKEKDL